MSCATPKRSLQRTASASPTRCCAGETISHVRLLEGRHASPLLAARGTAEAFSYTRTYLVERFLRVISVGLSIDIPAEAREIEARCWYVLCR